MSMNYENATHLLRCVHAIGDSRKHYQMRCHVLKAMPDGRLKLMVFGDRYWRNTGHLSRVRYVHPSRVTKITPFEALDADKEPAQREGER